MQLYKIPAELESLIAEYNAEATEDDRRLEVEGLLEALELELDRKADGIAHYVEQYTAEVDQIDSEIERLLRLKLQRERQIERLKRYLGNSLTRLGMTKLETVLHRFMFRSSKRVVIEPDAMIPREYCDEIPAKLVPQKAALKQAIEHGVEIPGVRIESKRSLQIK